MHNRGAIYYLFVRDSLNNSNMKYFKKVSVAVNNFVLHYFYFIPGVPIDHQPDPRSRKLCPTIQRPRSYSEPLYQLDRKCKK